MERPWSTPLLLPGQCRPPAPTSAGLLSEDSTFNEAGLRLHCPNCRIWRKRSDSAEEAAVHGPGSGAPLGALVSPLPADAPGATPHAGWEGDIRAIKWRSEEGKVHDGCKGKNETKKSLRVSQKLYNRCLDSRDKTGNHTQSALESVAIQCTVSTVNNFVNRKVHKS